jgi:hypothetical protein
MTNQRSIRRKPSKAPRPSPTNGRASQPAVNPRNLEAYTRHIADNIVANIDPNVGFVLITAMKDHATCEHTVIHNFTSEMAVHLLESAVDHV